MNTNELAVAKVLCEDLFFFSRFFFKKLRSTKWVQNWHQIEICNALNKVANYEALFLNINIPPRYSKTELIINFIAHGLARNPSGNYLYITASDDLRSEVSVRIRDIITSPEYKAMYGVELKKDQNAKNLWRTDAGGGLKTATIFGQITGFGAGQMVDHNSELEDYIRDFEGCICLDDINKIDDTESSNANNDKVTRVIFNTILSRTNSADTPLINIQQRSGLTDASAELLDHFNELQANKVINLVMPIVYNDKPLWEWKHDLDAIEVLRKSPKTAHIFETQYMQNPTSPKGLMYTNLQMVRDIPQGESVMYIDTADTGSDYLCAIAANLVNNSLYIKDVVYTQEPQEITETLVANAIIRNKVNRCIIESNNGGRSFARTVERILHDANWRRTQISTFTQSANKQTRILQNSSTVVLNCYFCENLNHKFMLDLRTYSREGKNAHDDAPDSLTGLCEKFITQDNGFFYI